ncbi:hypothetical protein M0R45_018046 [Rubus argutus]|uniref:KRR-R motif-containing protein 1 n=1 Tax=Rubus argutus TaxID=59490 RepID=A0AAW1XY55_RUBAR
MCLVLKNQNNNMAMGHIENGSAELQDKLEPLDEDLKITNFGPWLDEDGIILPVTSFSTLFKKKQEIFVQNAWPTVKSALEDYGIWCALNVVEGSMTVSTTTKTRDPGIIDKARELTELLSSSFPAYKAIRILGAKMKCDFIEIGSKRGGLCIKSGIDMASVFMKTSFDFHEHISTKFVEALHKIQDSDIEAIADKFRSSDSLGVQVNAEETLCAITRLAPHGFATKICNPSFIQRLLQHAMENSR